LEYYSGILFLTTNRVKSLDPAFQSRVTCALRYDKLSLEMRTEIWESLIVRLGIDASILNIGILANADINGRQIKNTLQLALALAQHDNVPLTQEHLLTTLDVTTSFLKDTSDWNRKSNSEEVDEESA
jgi:AAA+ superfamily predicted ATPase